MALDYVPAEAMQQSISIESRLDTQRSGAESFIRLEEKYFLPRPLVSELEQVLRSRLEPSYPDPSTRFNVIESIYYDSPSLDIFRNHFNVDRRRFKLRSRRYAPDGVWNEKHVHLELKAKDAGVCEKERLRIGAHELAYLHKGLPIPMTDRLIQKNSKIMANELGLRVSKINDEITRYRTRPFCRVVYDRRAFEKNGFRVTYDDSIRYELLASVSHSVADEIAASDVWSRAIAMRESYLMRDPVVIEIKHKGTIPSWMTSFLNNRPVIKASFSKYCFAVTDSILSGAATKGGQT